MEGSIHEAARAVERMDEYLHATLEEERLWKNNEYMNKRKSGEPFSLRDHVFAMVYAMLGSERVSTGLDAKKTKIEAIFFDFDPVQLINASPEALVAELKHNKCANRRIKFQMQALGKNIKKLQEFETIHGDIDTYYRKIIDADGFKDLVRRLSDSRSEDKMLELGVPLVSEYLRFLGYDVPKPDRHIRRILGSERLACSEAKTVPLFDTYDIVAQLADETNKTSAEIDYILWAYCANKYGEICTAEPKCGECTAKEFCKAEA